jgi:hypothetical protein
MSETVKPKTFREVVEFYNSFPPGRRTVGFVTMAGTFVFLAAIWLAVHFGMGFIVYLILAFLMFLCSTHSHYAFTLNLTQRKVRRIDYWYLSAATIALFLAVFAYSTQRETTIARFNEKFYEAGEPSVLAPVTEGMDSLTKFLCVDFAKAKEACAGLRKIASEIRPGRSSMDIASTLQEFEQKVVVPYALIFPADELRKNTNLLLPIVSVQIRIEDWGKYAEQAPKVDGIRSKFDDETEILLGVGQWVIWPFLFAYALALRITKVTIDVFDWAK